MAGSLEKNIQEVNQKIKDLEQTQRTYFNELYDDDFMEIYGRNINSVEEFFSSLGIENPEDFKRMSKQKLDDHVKQYTHFGSFEEMKSKAGEIYIMKYLRF